MLKLQSNTVQNPCHEVVVEAVDEMEQSCSEQMQQVELEGCFGREGCHHAGSVPEFLEAPLDPLDLQQEMKHFVVRLHQRGCKDGVQGPRNLQREGVNTTVHATLSMYTTSHRPAVKELIATIEATVDAVSFQGSCTGATQEPGNEAVDGAARLH